MHEVRTLEMGQAAARRVLQSMEQTCERYGFVTVADYYIACRIAPTFMDGKYGWNDLSGVVVRYGQRAFGLTLPRARMVNELHPVAPVEIRDQGNYYCVSHFLLQLREITKNEATPFVEVRFGTNDHYCDICGESVQGPYRIMPPKNHTN